MGKYCKNCDYWCDAEVISFGKGKAYHKSKEEKIHGFSDNDASLTKLGSLCPTCTCRKPERGERDGTV